MPNLNVAPSLELTDLFNLFTCTFVNLQFTLVYSAIIYKFCKLNFSFNIL